MVSHSPPAAASQEHPSFLFVQTKEHRIFSAKMSWYTGLSMLKLRQLVTLHCAQATARLSKVEHHKPKRLVC